MTLYQSEDPSPTLPTYRGKEEKGKIVDDEKGESNQANKKAFDLLLKPANPTPSNTRSTRLFQRDTERGIKVLRYCEVQQWGGTKVYLCAIKALRATRTGTYGKGRAPQSGCFRLHLILYSIHNTATDRRWERSQLSTPPAKKQAPLTTRSSSLRCVSPAQHHTAEKYSKTGKTKPQKHLPMSNLSWNTCQDFLKIPSL